MPYIARYGSYTLSDQSGLNVDVSIDISSDDSGSEVFLYTKIVHFSNGIPSKVDLQTMLIPWLASLNAGSPNAGRLMVLQNLKGQKVG